MADESLVNDGIEMSVCVFEEYGSAALMVEGHLFVGRIWDKELSFDFVGAWVQNGSASLMARFLSNQLTISDQRERSHQ